jgi:hypothetical protein
VSKRLEAGVARRFKMACNQKRVITANVEPAGNARL